jgi:hypothetical protein
MTKKKHEKPLHLDMSFDEALKRFAQTDPRELDPPKPKRSKRKKRASTRTRALPQRDEKPPAD